MRYKSASRMAKKKRRKGGCMKSLIKMSIGMAFISWLFGAWETEDALKVALEVKTTAVETLKKEDLSGIAAALDKASAFLDDTSKALTEKEEAKPEPKKEPEQVAKVEDLNDKPPEVLDKEEPEVEEEVMAAATVETPVNYESKVLTPRID